MQGGLPQASRTVMEAATAVLLAWNVAFSLAFFASVAILVVPGAVFEPEVDWWLWKAMIVLWVACFSGGVWIAVKSRGILARLPAPVLSLIFVGMGVLTFGLTPLPLMLARS